MFKAVRMLLGVFSAGCETLFYNSIIYRFGPRVAAYTLLFLVVSPGMFHAAPAFLPSTFSMYMVMLAYSAFLMGRNFWAVRCCVRKESIAPDPVCARAAFGRCHSRCCGLAVLWAYFHSNGFAHDG